MEREVTDLPPDMRDATAGEAEAYRRGWRDAVRAMSTPPRKARMPVERRCWFGDCQMNCGSAPCWRAEQLRNAATGLDYRGG